MQILIFILSLEFGLTPAGFYHLYDPEYMKVDLKESYYVEFDIELELWEHIYFKGDLRVDMWRKKAINFFPCSLLSKLDLGVNYKWFYAGIRQNCIHPIYPYNRTIDYYPTWEMAGFEVYIRGELTNRRE